MSSDNQYNDATRANAYAKLGIVAGAVRARLDAVKAFAGPDWEVAAVPPAARAILARFGATASHFERPEAIGG